MKIRKIGRLRYRLLCRSTRPDVGVRKKSRFHPFTRILLQYGQADRPGLPFSGRVLVQFALKFIF
jgi:hypothetical protein